MYTLFITIVGGIQFMNNQTVLVLDFGGQYKELIARRVRECHVYSIIKPGEMSVDEIKHMAPIGIILTGGPNSVYDDKSPKCDPEIFSLGIPVLGICYGMQLMCYTLGGTVVSEDELREYGRIETHFDSSCLFENLPASGKTLMSHTDRVDKLPAGFKSIAYTDSCPNAAVCCEEKGLYAFQFHPEVENTENGTAMIRNFVYNVCGAAGDFTMDDYIQQQVKAIRAQVGADKVLLGLSGGVDSSVCAALLEKAIPDQVVCIFVDHGCMRKNEGDEVEAVFAKKRLKFVRVNAESRFLAKLAGVTDPEAKRKIIGREFVEVFNEEARKYGDCKYLAQGTIYPDVIESGANNSATIKSHHNVGGLPEDLGFVGLVEPLRGLFKDEVRELGRQLKLSKVLINRQPFPGPGLAIRIVGEITKEKLDILRDADDIVRAEIGASRAKSNQYFAVLTNTKSVGVMGDYRTYAYTVAVRAVVTSDFMTCRYAHLPYSLLDRISSRIVNEVPNINRVVYDITGKPPATIEWE